MPRTGRLTSRVRVGQAARQRIRTRRLTQGAGGMSSERGDAAALSLNDRVGVTGLGGTGPHRPQSSPGSLLLTWWDVLTSWPKG